MIGPFFLQIFLSIIILLVSSSLLYFAYKKRIIKHSILEINSGNKDKNISLNEYIESITEYFTNLRYQEIREEHNTIKYIAPTMLKHRGAETILHLETLELTVEGPTYVIELLCRVLQTPSSSFKAKKK